GDVRVVARGVRKVELVRVGVEEQHRRALGLDHVAAFVDDERQELAQLEARGEGVAELVEEPEPGGVVELSHGTAEARGGRPRGQLRAGENRRAPRRPACYLRRNTIGLGIPTRWTSAKLPLLSATPIRAREST